jgi:hypothetical protein
MATSKTTIRIPPTTLLDLKNFLLLEGFHHTRWQHWKQGQVFGLVKRLNYKKQLHIRAFIDGTLKAEEEIWRFLIHLHLLIKPNLEKAQKKLKTLLKKYLTIHNT